MSAKHVQATCTCQLFFNNLGQEPPDPRKPHHGPQRHPLSRGVQPPSGPLRDSDPGADLPAEAALSEIAGVSRTVVRRCLARLAELGVIALDGRAKRVLRMPDQDDRIAVIRAADGLQALEQRFLDWILRFDVPAETPLSVAELARTFGFTQHQLNEFLAGLSRFGLVARRPKGGWMLRGFTKEFAVELSDFRLVLELDAIAKLVEAPVDHPVWPRLATLRVQHLALADQIDTHFHEFSKLDEAFHEAINAVVGNRFVASSRRSSR